MTKLVIIAAKDRCGVIGLNNGLPWSLPADMAFFKRTTMGAPVIMGRKTHESIGFALPGRENIVITSEITRHFKGCITAASLDAAIGYCEHHGAETAYLIGGASLYEQGLKRAHKLLVTEIDHAFEGDAYFPVLGPAWVETQREAFPANELNPFPYAFLTYEPQQVVAERAQALRAKELLTPQERWTSDFLAQTLSQRFHKNKGTTMKQYKHPGHILAIDKDFTDLVPGMGLQHGLTRLTQDEYHTWLQVVGSETVLRQRDGLEANPFYRQALPYSPIVFQDDQAFGEGDAIDWETDELSIYQRTKQIGEARLGGKFSGGYGGHIDSVDVVVDDKSVVRVGETIHQNLLREVGKEEVAFFNKDGQRINPTDHPQYFRFEHLGFIRDDSNNVGKVHLGIVNLIIVPKSVTIKVNENELKDGPRATAKELKALALDYEGWTQILIDDLSGSECSVLPSHARPATFDPVTHQYYIEAKDGDKLTELAIEFHTTVNRIKRINLHVFGDAPIPAGLRINVPYTEDEPSTLYTPDELVEAIAGEDRVESGKAKMTLKVLQMVLSLAGENLADHSMRYYVTEDMGNRLLALDERVQSLIDAGVVIVVKSDTPVVITGNLNISGDLVEEPTL